jgi:hypothetical protein
MPKIVKTEAKNALRFTSMFFEFNRLALIAPPTDAKSPTPCNAQACD